MKVDGGKQYPTAFTGNVQFKRNELANGPLTSFLQSQACIHILYHNYMYKI